MSTTPTKKVSEMTEQEMRDADVPWPKNMDELAGYIGQLTERQHDYGTCVYAMSMAATAAFYFVAHRLGVTGFQSSCADMDILRRTRSMKHGFRIVNAENLLYPQYDVEGDMQKWIEKARLNLADAAKKLLEETPGAAPGVRAHWEQLAATKP